jgi:F420 biosynthesis protein FbiB-like protein
MTNVDERVLLEMIQSRRSIRTYQSLPVPREIVAKLLEAARWAPSAHNRQPWRFAVVEAYETRRALAEGMGERLRADLERDGTPPSRIQAQVSRSYGRITGAPLVILACVTMRDMDVYSDARRMNAEFTMAVQSVAMAVQNLLLAAHAVGLGACWMCAPLFVPETVRDVLKLQADWQPQTLITLGYPAESKTKSRAPLEEVVRYSDAD